MSKPKKTGTNLIEEVLDNIRSDRNQAQYLLTKMLEYIAKNESQIKDSGFVAAKFLEALQKSNEQLSKVAESISKSKVSEHLTDDDKDGIYDQLEGKED